MRVIKIDPQTLDIVRENGRAVYLEDAEALKQKLYFRVKCFSGEFYLDPTYGIDWLGLLQAKPIRTGDVRQAVMDALTADQYVDYVSDVSVNDLRNGTLKIGWVAHTSFGTLKQAATIG